MAIFARTIFSYTSAEFIDSHTRPQSSNRSVVVLVRALGTSWRVRVSELTQVANRCSSVVVSNWTLRQLYASRRVNSLLTEQSSSNFNSVILSPTFTRLAAYSWRTVQFAALH